MTSPPRTLSLCAFGLWLFAGSAGGWTFDVPRVGTFSSEPQDPCVARLDPPLTSVTSSSAPWPDPITDLAQGMFITASRSLLDPNFSQTVVLLLEYDAEGALGLIVNRPTDVDLASLLPDSKWLEGRAEPVFIGGPVSRDHLVVLMRSGAAAPPDESGQVLSDTYVTGSLASLEKFLTTEVAGAEFRVFAGYAGWARGQLDSEVMRGDWHVSPADSQTVFELPPARVWPALMRRNSGQWVQLAPSDGEDQASR